MRLLILAFFLFSALNAQQSDYTHNLKGIKKVHIETNVNVKVIAQGSRLKLSEKTSSHKHYHSRDCNNCGKKKKEKMKGLTAIYPGGKDDTNGLGFNVETENNILIIRDLKTYFQRNQLVISIPKSMPFLINAGSLGNIKLDGFTSDVEAETRTGNIIMNNVTGPIIAHTNTGEINISFSKVNQNSPISIRSSTGEIDVTLPSTTKASLDIKTNAMVYTNFDIKTPKREGLRNVSGTKRIYSDINNGGVKIKLKSSMGNIYLRKK